MNVQVLIPLIATVAYIPLLVVLVANRPWGRKQKFFFLFLIPAILWSVVAVLGYSGLFAGGEYFAVKFGICTVIWILVQLHYFVSSFYRSERVKFPWAYLFLVATIVLTASGLIPDSIIITETGAIVVDYGVLIVVIGLLLLSTAGVRDMYYLIQKYRLSPDPAERNQIIYLLVSIGVLTVFLLGSYTPAGGEFPVSHIGNFVVACVLTYAVVTHRLADIQVVFRRALVNVVLFCGGLAIVLMLFRLAYQFIGFDMDFRILALATGLGVITVLGLGYVVGDLWQRKVEEAFMGVKSSYRKQLSQFVDEIYSVSSLEQLGNGFISLLTQSLDSRKACLLLPQVGDGVFSAQFIYPPVEDNPMRELKLKKDSPVVIWLEREGAILPTRKLIILPEFQSIWEEEKETIRSAGVQMFAPLKSGGRLVAVVAVGERRDGKLYSVEDIDLLESITAQVATRIEKEYNHQRLREQDEEVTLLNRLATIITSNISLQMIFENFAEELKKVVDVDWATVALIDGSELRFKALSSTIGSAWQTGETIPLEGTATEWVCQERQYVYEPDLKRHHRFWTGEHHLQRGVRSIIYLPLNVAERSIGSLIVASRKPNAYNFRQIRLLERVALHIAAPIENAQLYMQLEQKSRVDALTGLFNRRHFEERLEEEIARHSRYSQVFSIFMIDLDNFKSYNDIHGHPAGDILLSQIGKIIKNSIRGVDQAFRYGGDEFVVILPQTAKDDAYAVAERVRGQVLSEMKKKTIPVTCSIGLASYPADGVLVSELINVADSALYYAKRAGGNRVISSNIDVSSQQPENPVVDVKHNDLSAVYALVSAVEARDPYIYGHARKVRTFAVALAETIGLSPDEVSKISTAALLHDIGKIGIPEEVLNKKEGLDAKDWEAIKAHPRLGTNIISKIPSLESCVSGILHHHERWDGSGYPEGLKAGEIPLEARVIAIADAFEAMSSVRPYRPALSIREVIKELRKGAGTQFDPNLIEVFVDIIEAGFPRKAKISQDSSIEPATP